MDQPLFLWDLDDDPDGNVQHLAEHDVSCEEVEEVILGRGSQTTISRTSGQRITFGFTSEGRHLAVVWEPALADPYTDRPITAYDTPESATRRRRRRK